eukprot:tig00021036_g17336.t1
MERRPAAGSGKLAMEPLASATGILSFREGNLGISGGQRKRVSVGLELGTSGLDATTAQDLFALFRDLAASGLTILTVIHQPRFEIFEAFDSVALLGPSASCHGEFYNSTDWTPSVSDSVFRLKIAGGRLAYIGPPRDAVSYFESIGLPCPKLVNPADHVVDLLSGSLKLPAPSNSNSAPASNSDLGISIAGPVPGLQLSAPGAPPGTSPLAPAAAAPTAAAAAPAAVDLPALWEARRLASKSTPNSPPPAAVAERPDPESEGAPPGFFRQLPVFFLRALEQMKHSPVTLLTDFATSAVAGLILGIALEPQSIYVPPIPSRYIRFCLNVFMARALAPLARFFTMAVGLVSVTTAERTFGKERAVFWREGASGLSSGAYFLARCAADLLTIAMSSLVITAVFVMTAAPMGRFADYLGAVFATFGVGYAASSLLVNREGATLLAATAALIAGLGVDPEGAGNACWGRWVRREFLDADSLAAVEAYIEASAADADRGPSYRFDHSSSSRLSFPCRATLVFEAYDLTSSSLRSRAQDLAVLAAFGAATRLLAFLALRFLYTARRT